MGDAIKTNRIRCIHAIVLCSAISILVFLAISDQMLNTPDAIVQEVGWKSYHMFTILANMFMGLASAMCIPYAVDGLRYDNYHLPRWVVNVLFMATTGVALTLLIAITVLSPMTSFYRMMLFSNNILFHTINPILSILLFIFINSDHRVSLKSSVIAISPVVLYAVLYFVLVFMVGEEHGGWRDHYRIREITQYIPLPLVVLGMILIDFLVATCLRIAHNKVHERRKKELERSVQQWGESAGPDIPTAIQALAAHNRAKDAGGELIVPRRILTLMEKHYQSGLPMAELCGMYVDAYYQTEGEAKA